MSMLRDVANDYAMFDLHDVLAHVEHALTAAGPGDQAIVLLPGQPMTLACAGSATTAPPAVAGFSPDADRALNLPEPVRLSLRDGADPLDSLLARLYRGLADGHHWLVLHDCWDDEDDHLYSDTVHSLPAYLQPAQPRRIPATVNIDELGPFPATVVKGFTWNGSALPDFDLDTVRQIAFHLDSSDADDDCRTEITIADNGEVTLVQSAGTEDEDRTVYAGAGGRYPIGSWSWCWSVASTPTLPALPRPDAQLWFPWRDVKAHTEHACRGFGHQPVHYPDGGSSGGEGLVLTLGPGGATLRSNRPADALHPVPQPIRDRRLGHDLKTPAAAPIEVFLCLSRHYELRAQEFDRCAGWLVVNVWTSLPSMGEVPLAVTYQSHSVPEIDSSAYTWQPALLECPQFPGRVYPGQIAVGVTTATGAVLARFASDTVATIASDTACSAGTHGAVWVTCSGSYVELQTCLGDTAPDDMLQMGWAQQDGDGMFLLGAHQLDWQPAASR
ncbi:hypothetical protein [Catelliglobosispora koreensis]|uniref:hypothetical protein n=1 Tax=Catelliglobosispora koreensis TaxID=129052 RepID=UPI0003649B9D|nr:hypothetical protein [Catelliglobosispora koreensis]